jgi:hypothetical protein
MDKESGRLEGAQSRVLVTKVQVNWTIRYLGKVHESSELRYLLHCTDRIIDELHVLSYKRNQIPKSH